MDRPQFVVDGDVIQFPLEGNSQMRTITARWSSVVAVEIETDVYSGHKGDWACITIGPIAYTGLRVEIAEQIRDRLLREANAPQA